MRWFARSSRSRLGSSRSSPGERDGPIAIRWQNIARPCSDELQEVAFTCAAAVTSGIRQHPSVPAR
jgi:hypothetical protein